MSNAATYQTLRVDELTTAPNCAEHVAASQRELSKSNAPARHVGVWVPLIGVSSNTVTVATRWPGEPPASHGYDTSHAYEKVIRSKTHAFDVLARGQTACEQDGIYTHRWFVVSAENAEKLIETSVEAWGSSEVDTAMRVVGLWRSRAAGRGGEATILMIVRYPDLAAWDASRYWKPAPPDANQPNRHVWGELFRKRREILLDSWVTVHRLVQ